MTLGEVGRRPNPCLAGFNDPRVTGTLPFPETVGFKVVAVDVLVLVLVSVLLEVLVFVLVDGD